MNDILLTDSFEIGIFYKNLEIKKINDKKNASMEAQQKSLFEGFMLLKKMIYLQLKPSLHLWRLNLRLLNRRLILTKAMEVEAKKMKTGPSGLGILKGPVNNSQLLPGRFHFCGGGGSAT
ncbi:hypothetical protein HYC85_013200 [Camellia sinensis]|uniref:Uncharacterized protein n=1 Tax=Camellia sinensis TaxID=4442 RepID=A0A7J7H2Q5_CAMSI|nr:hypothetical protein HYC85_013200 [Camellia sinensis]